MTTPSAVEAVVRPGMPESCRHEPSPTLHSGPGTLLAVMMAGYPLAWALGAGPIIFPFVALLMVVWLIRFRPLRIPKGTLPYVLFLVPVMASIIQVGSPARLALWGLRFSWYVAALITFLYMARQTSPAARRRIVTSIVWLWMATIIGGYAAILAPDLTWPTPVAIALPGSIASDPFVYDLVVPRVSEIQTFWNGVRLDRPAAPYAYTNAWGSSFALLTPFALAALQERRIGVPRWLVGMMLVAGMVPFYLSLNRGAWLTLMLGIEYGVLRSAFVNRRLLPLVVLTVVVTLGLTLALTTGVLDTAAEALETRSADSNETRASIYLETIRHSAESPLIGFGTPQANPADPDGPPLGTHGQAWAIMLAHGYLALAFYLTFFGYGFIRGRGLGTVGHWAKVAVLVGLLQLPIYGHLPTQLFVMVGAVAIAAWPADALGADGDE